MSATLRCLALAALLGVAFSERSLLQQPGGATAENNYNPATIVVDSGDVIATPITPNAPYSQAALQCNVSGDPRIPGYSTYPLTVQVPKGKMVRVIFANGNLGGGATVTQQGEPGVIVQQTGAVIVQQSGSASPIVQNVSSPIVQQAAPPAALVVQQTPTTIVQQPQYSPAPVVQQAPSINQNPPPASPAPKATPTPSPPPKKDDHPPPSSNKHPPPSSSSTSVNLPNLDLCNKLSWLPVQLPCNLNVGHVGINLGKRRLLQDTVPGGPNNGLVEYVALAESNAGQVAGFVVPNTQFGVPYVEFTASDAAVGQTAVFKGALEVAVVVGGVPQVPFTPNKKYSPECQVNVNFQVV